MPPGGGGKRKRGDRTYGGDDGSRSSPYRPGSAGLAQHHYGPPQHGGYNEPRGRGGRRVSRGGRGGGLRSSDGPNGTFHQRRGSYLQQPNSQQQTFQQTSHTPSLPTSQPSQQPLNAPTSQEQASPSHPAQERPMVQHVVSASVYDLAKRTFPPPDISPAPYVYDYVSDAVVETWKSGGRESLLDRAKETRKSDDYIQTNILSQELLRSGLDGRIQPIEIGAFVKDVLATEVETDAMEGDQYRISPASAFLDCVSMLSDNDKKDQRLAALLAASQISTDLMREELDSDLLINLNLVRPIFNKAFIRHQTNMLYRQSNYNLLREETEGYSKLITELFTTSANEMPSAEVVSATFERVRSMIGTFDLDVGRVLDVTLDVFAAVLVKQHRFFVKFLRASSWWPQEVYGAVKSPTLPYWALPHAHGLEPLSNSDKLALIEARQARDKRFWEKARELGAQGKGILAFYHLRGLDFHSDEAPKQELSEEDQKWREVTGTDPPIGNRVAAQILGFKLRFYSSKARDEQDELPNNLVYLAALLIKIGFISLRDLYPHLWPEDDKMEAVKEQKTKEKAEKERAARPGAGVNALLLAAPLADDTVPGGMWPKEPEKKEAGKSEEVTNDDTAKSEENLPEPKDSKIQLLRSLLCIGALPEALYMIGTFPWLMNLVPDLADYFHRFLHYSISKLYDPLRPLQDIPELHEPAKVVDSDQSGAGKGMLKRAEPLAKRTLRWPQLDKYDAEEGIQYRFYWEDWNDNIPICQTIDDLFTLCNTLFNLSGVKIGQDPILLAKLFRIAINSLETDRLDGNKQRWIDLAKKLLIPALSLTRHNPDLINEAYEMLKHFSQTTRFSIYTEWYIGPTSRLPDMKSAFDLSRAETRDILRRISKTNVKPMARALAKVATSSPGVVFQVTINQMESYSNLVDVVVECARYFTYLGYDVLTWAILSALGRRGRDTTSADGMFASKWLIALASFFGRVYWRYSMMNLNPTLQFLGNQLRKGIPNELKVLEDIVQSMAGISPSMTYNDAQIMAMAGGPLLQSQTLLTMLDKRHESRSTAKRLLRSLSETRTLAQFLVAMAHERQSRLFELAEGDAPLKLLGNTHDEMHRIFAQYLDFLRSYLPAEEFDKWVPSFPQLVKNFGIEPKIAFWISRASIATQIADLDSAKAVEEKAPAAVQADGTLQVIGEHSGTSSQSPPGDGADAEMKELPSSTQLSAPATNGQPELPWHPVLKQIMDRSRDALASESLGLIGELYYVTFWQLSLNNMFVPTQSYEDEIARQKDKIREINHDRSDLSMAGSKRREKERTALTSLQDQLRTELKEQVSSHGRFTRNRMSNEKEHWFSHTRGKHDELNSALLEQCFIPRILLTPLDAHYCFRMLKMLHSTGAKNFRTMGFLDQFFTQKRLTLLFYMCTTTEAENLARFINEVLKDLSRWHTSKDTYEKEAYGSKKDLPGFCRKIGEEKSESVFLGYDDFRRLLYKWHGQLANALRVCLEGGEYMHIRNAIGIIRGIILTFPVVDMQAKKLIEAITILSKTDPRDDLKLAAMSLLTPLLSRERSNEFVPLASFVTLPKTQVANAKTAASPVPESDKKLNATAPEFKPTALNGTKAVAEYEDGEINSPKVAEVPKQVTKESASDVKPIATPSTAAHSSIPAGAAAGRAASSASVDVQANATDPPRIATLLPDPKPEARPSPAAANTPQPRQEYGRPANRSMSSPRPLHTLPTRPENLPPPRMPDRDRGARDMRSSRDQKDPQYPEAARSTRSAETDRSRTSGYPGPDSGHERASQRPMMQDRARSDYGRRTDSQGSRPQNVDDRPGRLPPRDDHSMRDASDRHGAEAARDSSTRGRPAVDAAMPPPAPVINPERARLIHGTDQPPPSRDDRRTDGRHGRDTPSRSGSQRGSRANSPRRDERELYSTLRDENLPPTDVGVRPRMEDRRSSGLRGDADPYIGHDDRTRGPPRSGPLPADGYASRHPRDYGPPAGESQYGRLNGPDTPTGPRLPNVPAPGRPTRAPSGPAAAHPPAQAIERPGSDRQAPSGPASNRPLPRVQSGAFTRPPPGSSAPNTPVTEAAPAVHPERARMLGVSGGPAPLSPTGPGNGLQTSTPTAPAARAGSAVPQGAASIPVNERGRGDKLFADINTTLQQSNGPLGARNDQGTSIRGRGARNPPQSPFGTVPAPGAGAMPPSGPGQQDQGSGRPEGLHPSRADLFAGHDAAKTRSGRAQPLLQDGHEHGGRRNGRSMSPTRRLPHQQQQQVGPGENMRQPRRMESARNLRSRTNAGPPPTMPERDGRRGGGRSDDYGSAKDYGRRGGGSGADRRDVRDINWGSERGDDRRVNAPPEGPGSGRKRRGEHEEYGDPKRNRRGGGGR